MELSLCTISPPFLFHLIRSAPLAPLSEPRDGGGTHKFSWMQQLTRLIFMCEDVQRWT